MTDQLTTGEDRDDGVSVVGGEAPRPATRAERRRARVRAGSRRAGPTGAGSTRARSTRAGSTRADPTRPAPATALIDDGAPEDAEPGDEIGPGDEFDGGRGEWSPPRGRRRARRPGTVPTTWALALAALALAGSGAAVTFGLKWSKLSSQAGQATTVRRVASTFLTQLTTFKPTTVDADFGALLTFATGDFAKQANQFFGTNIRQQLEQAQAESEGQIRNLYVQSLSGAKAEVYGVVDQTYTNDTIAKGGGQPVADVLRVVLDLTQVSGNWKISEVSVLQAPGAAGTSSSATVPGANP